ncbi:MAG: thiamine diphosphokinase, partial [Firmicutes bacterium]|nr:thiamine diphosphokinase [Bacillota bacterium]
MKRCVIIGGAPIARYDRIQPLLQDDDFVIYCDSGLKHQEKLNRKPDLIIGDFDSHEKPDT